MLRRRTDRRMSLQRQTIQNSMQRLSCHRQGWTIVLVIGMGASMHSDLSGLSVIFRTCQREYDGYKMATEILLSGRPIMRLTVNGIDDTTNNLLLLDLFSSFCTRNKKMNGNHHILYYYLYLIWFQMH
mmetsp:Transcript_1595/g.3555  ORF Transcript_1595/g.3555 Transcript_1595/m.3555 type:complete len:128 (-) Transcript_1595:98-481(-)